MPFLLTEPQRINGTKLGYAVYPYDFSFDDHIEQRDYNRKLTIFQLKDCKFVEVDHIVGEHRFKRETASREYINGKLQEFVSKNPQYVVDQQKVNAFFGEKNSNLGKN